MLTISLIAAGLMAVAALLMTRSAPAVRTADERGITLQTLIVTAVLVLMAVAAGVVIVAITNSASENLTEVDPQIAGNCNTVEVHDPTIAAGDVPGYNSQREVKGSASGCVPSCVWQDVDGDAEIDQNDRFIFNRKINTSPDIKFPGTGTMVAADSTADDHFMMFTETTVFSEASQATPAGSAPVKFDHGISAVRLSKGGDKCQAFSATGDVVTTGVAVSP